MHATPGQLVFLVVAGLVAGAVNAVAGGGSLLVFPALLAVGLNPLAANVTNSVAQWPGYAGIVLGNRRELQGQRRRIVSTSIAAALGSVVGCVLLLTLPASVFDAVVPVLVIAASVLMALGPRIKRWIGAPGDGAAEPRDRIWLLPVMFLAGIYGGYFGGALGVILISTLSLLTHDRLVRLNALKGVLSLVAATVTVVIFSLGAPVDWTAVAVVAPTTLIGGYVGARVARRLPETVLRWCVVALGLAVGVYLLVT
ncbi:sulfite exporter TauE/SafE family protein [Pseudonocardia sp. WMMC193]|uniref:sulfite exporter TauE/SafE family protein n=1 Tax=Pseudonocardia sp. WMMC193 TaxID=2911965 RepID=UPI001F490C5F|nr:sulfite exporter TauE/SafE family protein [Pseudonocardia sp. WMMC193]MCF7548529.1 sulfite exporter TauE/SafE family protein [Pseudonocardia sp. WMMC193]